MDYYLRNLVDTNGLFWWGWHRHYDVFKDTLDGHEGNHHEIHAINCINWEHLWQLNKEAVEKEIEALWQWHVINKQTGEINRHADGQRGCDFSMSSGAIMEAFSFLYTKTKQRVWLDRAILLADYYWNSRNKQTPKQTLLRRRPKPPRRPMNEPKTQRSLPMNRRNLPRNKSESRPRRLSWRNPLKKPTPIYKA